MFTGLSARPFLRIQLPSVTTLPGKNWVPALIPLSSLLVPLKPVPLTIVVHGSQKDESVLRFQYPNLHLRISDDIYRPLQFMQEVPVSFSEVALYRGRWFLRDGYPPTGLFSVLLYSNCGLESLRFLRGNCFTTKNHRRCLEPFPQPWFFLWRNPFFLFDTHRLA